MKIVIIGAGPGGYETAIEAARKGAEVTVISDGPLGGTCLNEGCIPTKALCRSAEIVEDLRAAGDFGIDADFRAFDLGKAVARKEQVIELLRSGIAFLFEKNHVRFISGKASFKDAHTVAAKAADGTVEEVPADYVIIAAGSHSASLPIPGAKLPGVVTSKEILELQEVPSKLCVIGAGVIGLEFASVFRSFGSEVSVVEFCPDILPRFDTDLAKRLKQALSKRGISIETSAAVQSISAEGDGLKVSYNKKDKPFEIVADKVLMAVGRRPNVDTLNLAEVGVEFTPKGIVTDPEFRTSVPNIFAVGDVNGGIMLAHEATFEGYHALNVILAENGMRERRAGGKLDSIRFDIVPAAVFTNPEVATVGLTEDDCKAKGLAVKCLKSFFRANGKAVSMGQTEGFCKLIVSSEDGRILGCHMFGAHSSDIIQEITALMNRNAGLDALEDIIHAHPTLGEVILSAARQ
jgi:dihydrolipoamide dehydrogenase